MTPARSIPERLRSLGAALGAALLLAGCGGTPLSPTSGSGGATGAGSGPEVLLVGAGGTVSFVPASVATALATTTLSSADRSLTVSREIDGAAGGVIRCGRFVLHVPAGAFEGTGTVTMRMPDSTVMVVDLGISPSSLNGFLAPVALAVNTTGADVGVDSLGMYWYDPANAGWTGLVCDKDLASDPTLVQTIEESANSLLGGATDSTSGLWTALPHFSKYAAGKAGW